MPRVNSEYRKMGAAMTEASKSDDAPTGTGQSIAVVFSGGGTTPGSLVASGPVRIAGRYEVLSLLGSGGMGTVYRARDVELDELVALKVLRRDLVDSPGMLARFRQEAKLARRVTHRNVARTFDIGEHEGEKFLTMEFVDGEALSSVIARRGRLPLAEVLHIVKEVCAGMSAAHSAGVVHRDLKPDNVLVARDKRVVVTDFGIAHAAAGAAGGAKTLGGIVGTPAYMAPEQVEAAAEVDARADLYALGAMIYELVTGKCPGLATRRSWSPRPGSSTRRRTRAPFAPTSSGRGRGGHAVHGAAPADCFGSADEVAAAFEQAVSAVARRALRSPRRALRSCRRASGSRSRRP